MKCPKHTFEITPELLKSYCRNCVGCVYVSVPGLPSMAPVDPFELARRLLAKRENDRRRSIPRLSDCPTCGRHSLFYDMHTDRFECMNGCCSYAQDGKEVQL